MLREIKGEFFDDHTGMLAEPFGQQMAHRNLARGDFPAGMERRWTRMLEQT